MPRALSLVAILVAVALSGVVWPSEARAKGDPGWIEGGDLPHRVYLSWEDSARMNSGAAPQVLGGPPPAPGTRYTIGGMARELAWHAGFEDGADDVAAYYPAARAVEVRLADGSSAWLRLDEKRAELLAIYRDLGAMGRLTEDVPSDLYILAIRVELSGRGRVWVEGSERDATALWNALASHDWPLRWANSDADTELWLAYQAAWRARFFDEPDSPRLVRLKLSGPGGRFVVLDYLPDLRKLVGPGYPYMSPAMPVHDISPDVAAELDALLRPERRTGVERAAAFGVFALIGGLLAVAVVGTLAPSFAARGRDERGESERDA